MQILTTVQFARKVKRMAHEIAEAHITSDALYLGGVSSSGRALAAWLAEELASLIDANIHLFEVSLERIEGDPLYAQYSMDTSGLDDRHIVIVDDVANTGSTLFYACAPLMKIAPASVKCAVMVDRTHKSYPMYVDYVGLRLATTLREHITVECDTADRSRAAAYLD